MNKQSNMFNPVRSNPHHKILLLWQEWNNYQRAAAKF